MNQQQRAGKHPSFSRDRKPPGLRRVTFLKRPEVPKPKGRKRKEKKKASTALTFAFSASSELDSERNNDLFSLIHKKYCERQKSDRTHDILGCFKVLALLDVEPVCQETVDACLAVCGNPFWAKTFLAGHFIKARGYLLHVAVHEATVSENLDLITRLLPQIPDRKLVICTLSTAESVLTDDSLLFFRFVYGMTEKSTDLWVKEALGLKEWLLLTRLLKVWHPARRATEAIAEAAITAAQRELVKLCAGHGVGKTLRNRALAEAFKSGQWDTVVEFVERGVKTAETCAENGFRLNDRVFCGRTILHEVIVCKRSVEVVSLLLQAGADPDVADTFGETALHAAVKRGFWSLIRLLLRYSKAAGKIASTLIQKQQDIASFITAYRPGRTLLHVLCEEGQEDIVELLLQAGADPDAADTLGETTLHAAVERGFWSLLRLLLRYSKAAGKIASTQIRKQQDNASFISAYRPGKTLLHVLCEEGQEDIVELLLQAGADPDVADTFGETALDVAVKRGFWSLLRLLLRYSKAAGKIASTQIRKQQDNASFISAYRPGKTLLHVLCEEGQADIVKLLLQAGADPDVADTFGETALDVAVKRGFWSLLRLLLRYSKAAGKIASTQIRKQQDNASFISAYRPGKTLLHVLCEEGQADIVELLLQAGADPDVADTFGETALHAAVKRGFWSLLRLLLRNSKAAGKIASTQIRKQQQQRTALFICLRPAYREGSTLLHALCEEGQADIVHTLLLMTGADPLVRDEDGNTLMMAAFQAAEGRENVYRALIQSGISTHQAVVSASPMKRAVEGGQLRIAKMLYASGACSNREVHKLSTSPTIRLKARRDVLEFLEDISSQPRRLRDLCSLTVSHLIGCRAGRDDRAARAGLPPPVRRQVLLEHVTNPEFLNDCLPSVMVSQLTGCGSGRDDSAARAGLLLPFFRQVLLEDMINSEFVNDGLRGIRLHRSLDLMLESHFHSRNFYSPCFCATTRRPIQRCSCRIKPE